VFVPDASTFAPGMDRTMALVFVITGGMLYLVTFLMILFAVRYRRGRRERGVPVAGSTALEVVWIVVPAILVTVIFFAGLREYRVMRTVPEGAMAVRVDARQWSWEFTYPDGRTGEVLRVPAGEPVKLLLHSDDVIHSLYIPAFRVKQDAVPGMETYAWFQATVPGDYDLFCAEYCGEGHSEMRTKVAVLPAAAFRAWYGAGRGPAPDPEELLEKHGCTGCHSTDGTARVGPTLAGIFGRRVTVVEGGATRTLTADEDYLRRSITDPGADVVSGFPDVMPRGLAATIPAADLDAIVAYLETLGARP